MDDGGSGTKQTDEQRRVLGSGGEDGGQIEPKSQEDWAARGASGGQPGKSPRVPGGSSQGSGDRTASSGDVDIDTQAGGGRPQPKPGEG